MQVCIIHTKTREVNNLPNIKSAKKRVKVIETKTLKNQMVKSALKTQIKKFEAAAAAGDKAVATEAFNTTVKKIDQAASKGILKKNTAARRKSKLATALNKVEA